MENRGLTLWLWPKNPEQLPGRQRGLRHLCRFLFIFFKEFKKDRISLRAAALTYSVVLSMVPMLALSTAVLKGMGAGDQMKQAAYRLIENLAAEQKTAPPPEATTTTPTTAETSETAKTAEITEITELPPKTKELSPEAETPSSPPIPETETAKDFSGHLYDAVDKVFNYVDRTNFAALGIIGTFLLLIAVLIVINGIEEAMNAIWQVEQSRSIGRKIMNYMALMIICPLTINLGIGATTMLNTPAIAKHLDTFIPLAWMQGLFFKLIPLFLLTLTFVLLYLFLPNIKIKAKAAWIGGLAAAIGLMAMQKVFILLQVGVANYNAIYGSFATVPLFLLWLHSAWLVFLLGAEVAYTTQHYQNYRADGHRLAPGPELALAFDLVNEIYKHFDQRLDATLDGLAATTKESTITTDKILQKLAQANLIRTTENQPETYLPATPATKLKAEEISTRLWDADFSQTPTPGRNLADTFFKAGNKALPENPWVED
ncbi:MAG: YihY/virulence factor BrkB family protein [Pseudomonadota bacterium]|nr:YihY/virulence factor BrkB family protein [Pseudomonadota bacterium]